MPTIVQDGPFQRAAGVEEQGLYEILWQVLGDSCYLVVVAMLSLICPHDTCCRYARYH